MKTLDAASLKKLFISAGNNLYNHYPEVDQLNVFPVPDGDTGMNMNLTITSGAKEIQNKDFETVYDVASSFSRGLLMGARGNSGVITSQIFRGFANALENKKEINAKDFADALFEAKKVAYKAVMRPVEGTILTVIRETSISCKEKAKEIEAVDKMVEYAFEQSKISLSHTPDLLPVLKEVGVVDSGGAGLVRLFEGMALAVKGKIVERHSITEGNDAGEATIPLYAGAALSEDEEGYGYCTQFVLRLGEPESGKKKFVEKNFVKFVQSHGKSVVTARDGNIVKVHVHTLTPGNMLNYAQQFGEFVSINVENMSEEHKNISEGRQATDYNVDDAKEEVVAPAKEYALIAVSAGKGLDALFTSLGVDVIVSGGQTMNPSTADFVAAIKKANAKNVFILPNNSNIVMAASQACDVIEGENIRARVIPSKTIPQGMTACMRFDISLSPDEIYNEMKGALKTVKSGSVTYAIKDTDIEGVHITKGFYMAMKDKNIVSCVKDKQIALFDLIDSLVRSDSSVLTVLVGEDIDDKNLESLTEELTNHYGESLEVTVYRGDQPVYSFLVGVE